MRETALRQQSERRLEQAQKQIATDQKVLQATLTAASTAQADRDEKAYKDAMAQGQTLFAQGKYEGALAAFQGAQRFKSTDEVKQMIDSSAERRAAAQAKSDQERRAIEQKFAAERERLKTAEANAKQREDVYKAALQMALDALAQKNYDKAHAKFQEAAQVHKSDAVLTGLRMVDSGRAAIASESKNAEAKAKLQGFIAAGLAALKAKDYDAAEKALRSASQLEPANPAVVQGLKDVAQGRQPAVGDKDQKANYLLAMSAGQKALQAKDYGGAIKSFQQALQLMPKDAQATQLLAQAQQAIDTGTKTQAQFKQAMDAGQTAMATKKYLAAVIAFNEALKLQPTDATAKQSLAQAQQALIEFNNQAAVTANYQKAMTAGKSHMSFKRYPDAVKAFNDALKLVPNDPQATQALQQAQQALDTMKTPPTDKTKTPPTDKTKTPPTDPNKAFNDAMKLGADAAKDQKYADAVKAFTEALKVRPKDKSAAYSLYMAQGQQYLDNMMFMQAQQQAQNALNVFPNDQAATKLLQKAKNKGK